MTILEPNYSVNFDEEEAKKLLNKEKITVSVDLDEGEESSTWWTCDFSEGYIKINSSYRTQKNRKCKIVNVKWKIRSFNKINIKWWRYENSGCKIQR